MRKMNSFVSLASPAQPPAQSACIQCAVVRWGDGVVWCGVRTVSTTVQPPSCWQPHSTTDTTHWLLLTTAQLSFKLERGPAWPDWQPTILALRDKPTKHQQLEARANSDIFRPHVISDLNNNLIFQLKYKILFHIRDENFTIFTLYFSILGKKKDRDL